MELYVLKLLQAPTRVVTRLDGARGKKQVWHPQVRIEVFLEANALYWRKYSWDCWDFSTPCAVIRCPRSDSAPGELCPLLSIITPLAPTQWGFLQNEFMYKMKILTFETCSSVTIWLRSTKGY